MRQLCTLALGQKKQHFSHPRITGLQSHKQHRRRAPGGHGTRIESIHDPRQHRVPGEHTHSLAHCQVHRRSRWMA